MDPGTYTLLLELESRTEIRFGAAGRRELEPGWYAYTGSAFGPGGLKRVARHRNVCEGTNKTRQWHIDYLLGTTATRWIHVWTAHVAAECEVHARLPGKPIDGIGASDCDCSSHLTYNPERTELEHALERIYDTIPRN